MIRKESIEYGFLFLDGEYVDLPYEIEFGNGEMWVNGTNVTELFPKIEPSQNPAFGRMRNRPWDGGGPYSGGPRFSRLVADALEGNGVVILQTSETPVYLDQKVADQFLSLLINDETRKAELESDLSWIPPAANNESFIQWLEAYHAPALLRKRIEQRLAAQEATNDMNTSQRAAVQRLDQWGYPLTVLGMVLVVAGFGHLLSRQPQTEPQTTPVNLAPEAIRQTNWSLVLVVAMSVMDLVWTILIFQAGVMRELNPLGSRLLEDPVQLTIFKVALTALAVGLIFGLRRYRRAQTVSWWGCLLFTLLTVRWVTLNTLFV